MEYYFKESATRDLKKLPKIVQKRIFNKLDFYTTKNKPLKFAEPLKDKMFGDFRFRIGDYRVVFDLDFKHESIIVLAVSHRKNIYK